MSWRDPYQTGFDFLAQLKYEEALEAFNQAISDNDQHKDLFQSRALVLEMLGLSSEARNDRNRSIGLEPRPLQEYMHPGRLFFPMLGPVCYLSKLPIELQVEVFTLAIAGRKTTLLMLTSVCRQWRGIINGTPPFWRHLVLTHKTTQEEADAWLQRARGWLSSLRIDDGFSFLNLPDVFRNASPEMWSNLGSFEIESHASFDLGVMRVPEMARRLRSEQLKIHMEVRDPSSEHLKLLVGMDMSRTRSFQLAVKGYITLSALPLFTALTRLQLFGHFYLHDLMVFLERCPTIKSMILSVKERRPAEESSRTVALPNLTHLALNNGWVTDDFTRSFVAPKLDLLSLGDIKNGDLGLESIASQRLARLGCICLGGSTFSRNTVIRFLRECVGVRRLILKLAFSDGGEDDVIDALAGTIPGPVVEAQGTTEMLCCPRLVYLDVSSIPNLSAGPLVRLVKARLPRTSPDMDIDLNNAATAEVLPHPLLSLDMRASAAIDYESIVWLLTHVPDVNIVGENIIGSSNSA